MSTTDGVRPDWPTKDFYQVLGVAKDASASDIKKAYRKLARANHPDSNPGDTAKHDTFKAVAEAYDVIGDPEKRTKYDEVRAAYASGGYGFPQGGFNPGSGGFDVSDLFGDRARGGGGLGDMFGDLFANRGRTAAAAPAAARVRRRDQRHDRVHRGAGGRHHLAAADLGRALPRLLRHRRQARHPAPHLPRVRGRRLRGRLGGRRVLHERDLPGVRWPPARLRRAVPDLPRLGPGHLRAVDPGPDPGRGEGRPADPAQGQGRRRRERRAGRRPVRAR